MEHAEQIEREDRRGQRSFQEQHVLDLAIDDGVLQRILRSSEPHRSKFLAAFGGTGRKSPAAARTYLLRVLAFWARGDFGRIDRLFRRSGLMSGAWNGPARSEGAKPGETLGEFLVGQAIDRQGGVYWSEGATAYLEPPARLAVRETQVLVKCAANTLVSHRLRPPLSPEVKTVVLSSVPAIGMSLREAMLRLIGRLKETPDSVRIMSIRGWIGAIEYWLACFRGKKPSWAIVWREAKAVYDRAVSPRVGWPPPIEFAAIVDVESRVVGAARHFADWFGEPFSLSTSQAAEFGKTSRPTAARILRKLVISGELVAVKQWPSAARKATEYAFPIFETEDSSDDQSAEENRT